MASTVRSSVRPVMRPADLLVPRARHELDGRCVVPMRAVHQSSGRRRVLLVQKRGRLTKGFCRDPRFHPVVADHTIAVLCGHAAARPIDVGVCKALRQLTSDGCLPRCPPPRLRDAGAVVRACPIGRSTPGKPRPSLGTHIGTMAEPARHAEECVEGDWTPSFHQVIARFHGRDE